MATNAGHVAMIPSSSVVSSSPGGAQQNSSIVAGALASFNAVDISDDDNDIISPALPAFPQDQNQDQEAAGGWFSSFRDSPWSLNFSFIWWAAPTTPTSPAGSVVDDDAHAHAQAQGPLFAFVLALLAYGAGVMTGVISDSKDTVSRWSTMPKVVYGVTAVVAIGSLAVGFMAAGWYAAALVAGGGNRGNLTLSEVCAKLGAILSTVLLVVSFCCKLGRWGCATGVPCAAVIAVLMAVVWIWGDERAAARAVRGCWRRVQDLCHPRLVRTTPALLTTDFELAVVRLRQGGDGMEHGDELAGPAGEDEDGMIMV